MEVIGYNQEGEFKDEGVKWVRDDGTIFSFRVLLFRRGKHNLRLMPLMKGHLGEEEEEEMRVKMY